MADVKNINFICLCLFILGCRLSTMDIVNNNMAYAFEVENKHSKREKIFHTDYDQDNLNSHATLFSFQSHKYYKIYGLKYKATYKI